MSDGVNSGPSELPSRGPAWLGVLLAVVGGLLTWTVLTMVFGDFTWPSFLKAIAVAAVAIAVLLVAQRRRHASRR